MCYKRVLIKISGEALGGKSGTGLDASTIMAVAKSVAKINQAGIEIALVVGGGNFFRGLSDKAVKINRIRADYIGMLGTVMNAIALADFLEQAGMTPVVHSALEVAKIGVPATPLVARQELSQGKIVIFAGGTGNPFFSTDTTAAMRAAEIEAELIMKATMVDGVYSADPKKVPDAKRFDKISFDQVIEQKLKVMDLTAITMCQQNNIPIMVFNMTDPENIFQATQLNAINTLISNE